MEPTSLAIIVAGCSFVAFWVGRVIGTLHAYNVGYADGADNGARAAIEALGKQLNIDVSYDLKIKDEE